jgi:predicted KAP-like P-loop ATPase
MKIIDKRIKKQVLFKYIDIGECFINSNNVYIKISSDTVFNFTNSLNYQFGEKIVVTPIEAELIIKE